MTEKPPAGRRPTRRASSRWPRAAAEPRHLGQPVLRGHGGRRRRCRPQYAILGEVSDGLRRPWSGSKRWPTPTSAPGGEPRMPGRDRSITLSARRGRGVHRRCPGASPLAGERRSRRPAPRRHDRDAARAHGHPPLRGARIPPPAAGGLSPDRLRRARAWRLRGARRRLLRLRAARRRRCGGDRSEGGGGEARRSPATRWAPTPPPRWPCAIPTRLAGLVLIGPAVTGTAGHRRASTTGTGSRTGSRAVGWRGSSTPTTDDLPGRGARRCCASPASGSPHTTIPRGSPGRCARCRGRCRSRGWPSSEPLDVPALVVASHDEADPGHPYAVAEAWAEALPRRG